MKYVSIVTKSTTVSPAHGRFWEAEKEGATGFSTGYGEKKGGFGREPGWGKVKGGMMRLIRSRIPDYTVLVFFFNQCPVFYAFFQVSPEHCHLNIPDI